MNIIKHLHNTLTWIIPTPVEPLTQLTIHISQSLLPISASSTSLKNNAERYNIIIL